MHASTACQQKEQKMDTLIKTPPAFRLKLFAPSQLIQTPELWSHLTLEQQQKVLQVLVITCRQIVQRLDEEQEERNED
jgi:hypothetical protein